MRFVKYSRSGFEKYPLQIYSGALLFAPTMSLVKQHFAYEIPKWITRLPQLHCPWDALLQTSEFHPYDVVSLAFSFDSRLLAISSPGSIKIWDVDVGEEIQTLKGVSEREHFVSFSPNNNYLASSSLSSKIELWEVSTGVMFRVFEDERIRFLSSTQLAILLTDQSLFREKALSGTSDLHIKATLLDTEIMKERAIVAYEPIAKKVGLVFRDGTIMIYDVKSPTPIQTIRDARNDYVRDLFWSHGALLALSISRVTGKGILRDVQTGRVLLSFRERKPLFLRTILSPDGNILVKWWRVYSNIELWDVRTGVKLRQMEGHGFGIYTAMFSPDGKTLVTSSPSSSIDAAVQLWDVNAIIISSESHYDYISTVACSSSGSVIASASTAGNVGLSDLCAGKELCRFDVGPARVKQLKFSSSNKFLAMILEDDTIQLREATKGTLLFRRQYTINKSYYADLHDYPELYFSPCEQRIGIVCGDKIEAWNIETMDLLKTLKIDNTDHRIANSAFGCTAFSPDGVTLASELIDLVTGLSLWNIFTGDCLQFCTVGLGRTGQIIKFSPSGNLLGLEELSGQVTMWNARTGEFLYTFENLGSGNTICFSPDDASLVVRSLPLEPSRHIKYVQVWDMASGRELKQVKVGGPVSNVCCLKNQAYIQFHTGQPFFLLDEHLAQQDFRDLIFLEGSWICLGREKVLWLPPEYRPRILREIMVIGNLVTFVAVSNRRITLEINPEIHHNTPSLAGSTCHRTYKAELPRLQPDMLRQPCLIEALR